MKKEDWDLNIKCSKEEHNNFIKEIQTELAELYDVSADLDVGKMQHSEWRRYIIKCKNEPVVISVRFRPDENLLEVYYINGPNPENYNRILSKFYNSIKPICEKLELECVLVKDISAETSLSSTVYNVFSDFMSFSYNHHPLDDDRWSRFVIAAIEANEKLSSDMLKELLIHDYNMDEFTAEKLSNTYKNGFQLFAVKESNKLK